MVREVQPIRIALRNERFVALRSCAPSSLATRHKAPNPDAKMVVVPPHHGRANTIGAVDDHLFGHALPFTDGVPTRPVMAVANILLYVRPIGLVAAILAISGLSVFAPDAFSA